MFSSLQETLRDKSSRQRFISDHVQIIAGSILIGIGYNLFFVPNTVVSGGISGIAVIIHHINGWPVGLVTLAINIPLFIAGIRWGGGITTGLRTIISVVVMSATIDLTAPFMPAVTKSPLLYVAYGGILDGLGLGLVLRAQATTGGTDIIARLLRHFTGLEISRGMFISNTLIIAAAALVFDLEKAMYGIMVTAISSWTVDGVLAGGRRARQAFIISDNWDEIRLVVLEHLERGITLVESRGGYTGKARPMLMCTISPREIAELRRLIDEIDPDAFVVIGQATEVYGEGFTAMRDNL